MAVGGWWWDEGKGKKRGHVEARRHCFDELFAALLLRSSFSVSLLSRIHFLFPGQASSTVPMPTTRRASAGAGTSQASAPSNTSSTSSSTISAKGGGKGKKKEETAHEAQAPVQTVGFTVLPQPLCTHLLS